MKKRWLICKKKQETQKTLIWTKNQHENLKKPYFYGVKMAPPKGGQTDNP